MLAVLLALFTTSVTMSDALVRNPRFCSPNGQYCVVVREYSNLPDFAAAKAKVLVSEINPNERRATLYANRTRVARTIVPRPYRTIHVTNEGRFVVVRELNRPIVGATPLLDVFTRGAMHTLTAGDLFAPTDFDAINRHPFELDTRLDGAQVVVVNAIRVSLATARPVDPQRDLYPSPHTWVTASKQMLARAVQRPLPAWPAVAWKARVSGSTMIEVVVSEEGRVTSSRVLRPFPFGIDAAAQEAAHRWTFTRQAAEWQGLLEFHFGLLTEEECRKVQCDGIH